MTHGPHLDDLPDVLTAMETARFLRRSLNSVYAALRRGEIRSVRIGRRKYLVPKAAIIELLNGTQNEYAAENKSAAYRGGRDGSAASPR